MESSPKSNFSLSVSVYIIAFTLFQYNIRTAVKALLSHQPKPRIKNTVIKEETVSAVAQSFPC